MIGQRRIVIDKNTMRAKAIIQGTITIDGVSDIYGIKHFYPNDDEFILVDNDIDVPINSVYPGDKIVDKNNDGIYEIDQAYDFIETPRYYIIDKDTISIKFKDLTKEQMKNMGAKKASKKVLKEAKYPVRSTRFLSQERLDFEKSINRKEIYSRVTQIYDGIKPIQEYAIFKGLMLGDITMYVDKYYNIHLSNVDIPKDGIYDDEELKIRGVHWKDYLDNYVPETQYPSYNPRFDLKTNKRKKRKYL